MRVGGPAVRRLAGNSRRNRGSGRHCAASCVLADRAVVVAARVLCLDRSLFRIAHLHTHSMAEYLVQHALRPGDPAGPGILRWGSAAGGSDTLARSRGLPPRAPPPTPPGPKPPAASLA